MIKINLLPVRAAKKRENLQAQFAVGGVVVILVVLVMFGVQCRQKNKLQSLDVQTNQTQQEISRLEQKIGEMDKFKDMKQVLQSKIDIISLLVKGKTGPVHMLDELSRNLSERLWLESLDEKGNLIMIKGVADRNDTIAEFMTNLERSDYFQNVDLILTERKEIQELKLTSFSVSCRRELPK